MATLSRSQLVVYAAVGIALLVVGARWIRASAGGTAGAGGVSFNAGGGSSSSSGGTGTSPGFGVAQSGGEDVVVDVTGAVRDSGVYRMPAGSRVDDAVKRAGGATGRGDVAALNLAARLSDGQQVIVPARALSAPGATAAAGAAAGGAATATAATAGPINLASATLEQLDTIDGIGPVTAQDIIDFRDQHGGISSIDELDQISGIGPATMEALRARLVP